MRPPLGASRFFFALPLAYARVPASRLRFAQALRRSPLETVHWTSIRCRYGPLAFGQPLLTHFLFRRLKDFRHQDDYGLVTRPAFEEIEREFGPMIRRIAVAHEANRALAEELVQDIWLELWRALPSFRGASSLKTFVARVASYRAITHIRHSARNPRPAELPDDIPAPDPNPEDHVLHQDRQTKLIAAVRALSLPLRQVSLLTLEGLTPQEIASVLGITANAVAIRLSRAKQILRNTLGDTQ